MSDKEAVRAWTLYRVVFPMGRGEWQVARPGTIARSLFNLETLPVVERAPVVEVLHNAEEFIVTVQKWMGSPDDRHEALDELRALLADLDPKEATSHDTPR